MNVALYARTACPDRYAIDCQLKSLNAFAEEHNLDVVDVAKECGSGIRADRPELIRVESLAADGKIDAIVVTDISRLFRDTFLYRDFAERMESYGVKIFMLDRLQRLL